MIFSVYNDSFIFEKQQLWRSMTKKSFLTTSLLTLCLLLNSEALSAAGSVKKGLPSPSTIVVNNRVLLKANGKSLTVMDVMKKMDVIFYREFPNLENSKEARFQFYSSNWKNILLSMIDNELIMADAKDKKLTVSDGDVRQELEELFGPNAVVTIDSLNLTYQEVWDMVLSDIIVRRMTIYMINAKAITTVIPQHILAAYEKLIKENRHDEKWVYQVLSVQAPDQVKAAEVAKRAHATATLRTEGANEKGFKGIQEALEAKEPLDPTIAFNISEEYHRSEKEISSAHREILITLEEGAYSQPIAGASRTHSSTVYRIFYVKEHESGGEIPFHEVEDQIKSELLDIAVSKESDEYLKKLRKHYRVDEQTLAEMVPTNFQPFSLN